MSSNWRRGKPFATSAVIWSLTYVWCRSGLVESSKIRSLVGVLEKNGSIELAHVYTESYGAMPSDRHVVGTLLVDLTVSFSV